MTSLRFHECFFFLAKLKQHFKGFVQSHNLQVFQFNFLLFCVFTVKQGCYGFGVFCL